MKSWGARAVALVALLLAGCGGHGDVVNNGSGSAERQFALALERLHVFLEVARRTAPLSALENKLLERLLLSLPREKASRRLLRWTTQTALSREGIPRAAWTDAYVGAPIYLSHGAFPDKTPDLSSVAIATLVHELGHHQEITDHDWLDRLGAKVARAARLRFHEVSSRTIYPDGPETIAFALDDDSSAPRAWISYRSASVTFDIYLSALVKRYCRTPLPSSPLRLGAPQWALVTPRGRLDELEVGSRLELTIPIVLRCEGLENIHLRSPRLRMALEASNLRQILLALPAKLSYVPDAFLLWVTKSFFTDVVDKTGTSLLE